MFITSTKKISIPTSDGPGNCCCSVQRAPSSIYVERYHGHASNRAPSKNNITLSSTPILAGLVSAGSSNWENALALRLVARSSLFLEEREFAEQTLGSMHVARRTRLG